jgi:hypothetical protein
VPPAPQPQAPPQPPPPPPNYGAPSPPPNYGAPPPPPPPPPGYGAAPYGAPQQPAYGYAPPQQTEGTAIGALIASIVAWVACPIIPAIVALVLIPGSRRKIAESGGRMTGEGLLTAAKWVSIIHLAFWGLLIVLFVFLAIVGTLAGDTNSSDFSLGLR